LFSLVQGLQWGFWHWKWLQQASIHCSWCHPCPAGTRLHTHNKANDKIWSIGEI
jgi:hypothetical protein